MTIEEYKEKVNIILSKARADYNDLCREYARSNDTVKMGDIVNNILVDKKVIRFSIDNIRDDKIPEMIYHGVKINKNGKPNKLGTRDYVFQHDIEGEK